MTNQSMARAAELTGMAGGVLFTFYFIAINPLLNRLGKPFLQRLVAAIKRLNACAASARRLIDVWLLPGYLIRSGSQDCKSPEAGSPLQTLSAGLKSH
jgi:hypothetical protein